MNHVSAIIVAAGEGRRMGAGESKSFVPIRGRPLLLRTLERFYPARAIGEIIVVVQAGEFTRCEAMVKGDSKLNQMPLIFKHGGATRQQSVKSGLESVSSDAELVLIHDGARPLVSPGLIDRCIAGADESGAVVAGLPVRNTIKIVSDKGWVQGTPARRSLWEIQTPQVFRKDLIVAAHDWAMRQGIEATDDAMLLEQMGKAVFVIEGERTNVKITFPEDVWLAEALIRDGEVR